MFPGLPAGRQPPLSRSWGERRFSTPRRFLLHLRFIHPWLLFGREVSSRPFGPGGSDSGPFHWGTRPRPFGGMPTSGPAGRRLPVPPRGQHFPRSCPRQNAGQFLNFVPPLLNRGSRLGSGPAPDGTCNPGRLQPGLRCFQEFACSFPTPVIGEMLAKFLGDPKSSWTEPRGSVQELAPRFWVSQRPSCSQGAGSRNSASFSLTCRGKMLQKFSGGPKSSWRQPRGSPQELVSFRARSFA